MSAATVIERLPHAKLVSPGRWRSGCPCCGGKNVTKVSIRELPDDRVLLWGFCGCGAAEILSAVGLSFGDLFAESYKAPHQGSGPKAPGHWHVMREAFKTILRDCLICAIAAEDIAEGRPISPEDAAVVANCAARIRAAVKACI